MSPFVFICAGKMESDGDNSNNDERNELMEEEIEREDDENSGSDDDSRDGIAVSDPNKYYLWLMDRLRRDECSILDICHPGVFYLILENVDEFCSLIHSRKTINEISIGDISVWNDVQGPVLHITEDNKVAWMKFIQALGSASCARELTIGGNNLSWVLMTRLVEGIQQVKQINWFFPWRAVCSAGMRPFLHALLRHPSQNVSRVGLYGDHDCDVPRTNLLAQIFRLPFFAGWMLLDQTKLTREECSFLGRALSSNTCDITSLLLRECSFLDESGQLVAKALERSSLLSLELHDVFGDMPFCSELQSSLALNEFIVHAEFHYSGHDCVLDVVELVKNIAIHNKSLKKLLLTGDGFHNVLSTSDRQELQEYLQRNHTLESLLVGDEEQFEAITTLNQAGRRYLSEDPHSNSKCIAVLAKVKHNLDSLYFHLRENPILCISFCKANAGPLSGRKRKARSG